MYQFPILYTNGQVFNSDHTQTSDFVLWMSQNIKGRWDNLDCVREEKVVSYRFRRSLSSLGSKMMMPSQTLTWVSGLIFTFDDLSDALLFKLTWV